MPAASRLAAAALALAAALCGSMPAAAQVVRCTDPSTGAITYTDGPCRRGEAAREVAPAKTPEEIAQERAQAEQAQAARRARLQQEAEQRRDAAAVPLPPPIPRPADPAQSSACQRARQALKEATDALGGGLHDEQARLDAAQQRADLACLTPAEQARAAARRASARLPEYAPPAIVLPPRPTPRPPRREISHCNVFRCYDKQGNSYPIP